MQNNKPHLAFEKALHVGQLNLPDKDKLKKAFQGIFERNFYTNHGPLVNELDRRVAEAFGVKHAICVTNGTVALMSAIAALGIRGEVIVPSFTFIATVQSIIWAGLTPIFCDVDPETHNITPELVAPLITEKTSAVMAVHLWGGGCDVEGLKSLTERHSIKLLFDAAHAVGSEINGQTIGGFGDLECFSFHATKVMCAAEGGCITTNNDQLADKVRTARNFHTTETFSNVMPRINGKMTEAQAAISLLSLDELENNISANEQRFYLYKSELTGITGVNFVDYTRGEKSNYQYIVIEIDDQCEKSRDGLVNILKGYNILARSYFSPGTHTLPFVTGSGLNQPKLPVTERLCLSLIQLPNGMNLSLAEVKKTCAIIRQILEL